jgi:hypothetical protein
MGFLLLWLRFDCGGNAGAHKDVHKQWAQEPHMRFEEGLAARVEAMKSTDPVLVACFGQERPERGDDSRGEPRTFA